MNQGEAAETIVRMSLNGLETAVKISGTSIKGALALIYAYNKNNAQLKGKTSLNNMLKSGKELKVFSIKEKDLEKFVKHAKKYGVLYSALIDKKGNSLDGMVDIMVRAEDAPRINRIVEKFNLVSFNETEVRVELDKDKANKMLKEKGIDIKDKKDITLVDEILGRDNAKDTGGNLSNPELVGTEKNLSKNLLENKKSFAMASKRESVKNKLNNIRREQKGAIENDGKNTKQRTKKTPIKGSASKHKKNIERI